MSTLETVLATLQDEFSDLSDAEQTTRVCLRLFLAALLGGLLGFERERNGQAAGIRTHMLVSLGAAMFVLAPLQSDTGTMDDAISRVIQGIAAGIGFLCAGTILKRDRLSEVKGLTTAAGIWLTTAIGVAVGLGHEGTAILATVLALLILKLLPCFIENPDRDRV